MARTPQHDRTTLQLAEEFLTLALARERAIMGDQTAKANQLFRRIQSLRLELRGREGDHRRYLAVFFNHPDPHVRLEAAMATLAIFPEQAREILQLICDRNEFPTAGDAGHTLLCLKRGDFKPQ